MLAFFGIILAALMGVTALALDMGIAGLAHARLETAAEFVALEGARGASEDDLREQASVLLAEGPDATRVQLGPIGPLEAGDAGCAGGFPATSGGVATLARRIPLLFGHGSMLSFASPTSWGQILAARTDPTDPDPTPVLPDGSIPPGTPALREQGLCVEGRASASLEPALAVAGDEPFELPGLLVDDLKVGLSIRVDLPNPLWESLTDSQETTCLATAQDGDWFELSTELAPACEPGHTACAVPIRSEVHRVGADLDLTGGLRASLEETAQPINADLHQMVVATVRDGANAIVGFASLCLRRAGTTTSVSMRWNDAATPFSAFTSELHASGPRAHWESFLKDANEGCHHDDDENLRCFAQSAVLTIPGEGA